MIACVNDMRGGLLLAHAAPMYSFSAVLIGRARSRECECGRREGFPYAFRMLGHARLNATAYGRYKHRRRDRRESGGGNGL